MIARVYKHRIILTFQFDRSKIAWVKSLPESKWHRKRCRCAFCRDAHMKGGYWTVPATPWYAMKVVPKCEIATKEVHDLVDKYHRLKAMREILDPTDQISIPRLRPYQTAAVCYIEEAGGRCLVGDAMGLGKTVVSLTWADLHNDITTVLVVAPASVIYKWEREVRRWSRFEPQVISTSKTPLEHGRLHIMSYDIMRRRVLELMEWGYDLTIFDECHYLKGRKNKTLRVQAAQMLAFKSPYLLGLSGTPFLSRPAELWNMLHFLNANEWVYFYPFGIRYCGGQRDEWRGATNREELTERLVPYMIRRLKQQVLDQLPELTRINIPIRIPEMTEYRRLSASVREAIKNMDPNHKGFYVNALDRLNLLRRAVGKNKVPIAVEWIHDFLASGGEKLVVYCHHHETVEELERRLDYEVTTITGSVDAKTRDERVTRFQSQETPRILITTSAGGEGIDLFGVDGITIADILFVEREWTPAKEEQMESRLHRMGQKNAVTAWYLVAENTIDEHMAALIERKRKILGDIIGIDEPQSIVWDILKEVRDGR